jgi:5'-phosphate synthase pdxT subunit
MRIGILAMQGDVAEHARALGRIEGVETAEVRAPGDLNGIDGLVLPGGESTTIGKLMVSCALMEPVRGLIAAGLPVLATCAGAVMMARDIGGHRQPLIGAMDLVVRRNAFGRQLESFEADLTLEVLEGPPLRAVFIRAPAIAAVGPGVSVLARLPDGTIVAAQQDRMIAASFHPELTDDPRFHEYFTRLVAERMPVSARP